MSLDYGSVDDNPGFVGKPFAVREDRLLCTWSYLPGQGRSIRL
jgi:hypothetical protein